MWKEISGNRANKAKSEEKYIPRLRSNIVVFPTYRFFAFDNLESDEWHQVSRLFFTVGTKKADWSTLIRLVKKTQLSLKFLLNLTKLYDKIAQLKHDVDNNYGAIYSLVGFLRSWNQPYSIQYIQNLGVNPHSRLFEAVLSSVARVNAPESV